MSEITQGHDAIAKRARAKPVNAKRFITIYQASESVAEVAEKTGLTVHTVSQRASTYRKKGVPMRAMPNTGTTVRNDWKELAELAMSLLPEDATTVPSAATEEEE